MRADNVLHLGVKGELQPRPRSNHAGTDRLGVHVHDLRRRPPRCRRRSTRRRSRSSTATAAAVTRIRAPSTRLTSPAGDDHAGRDGRAHGRGRQTPSRSTSRPTSGATCWPGDGRRSISVDATRSPVRSLATPRAHHRRQRSERVRATATAPDRLLVDLSCARASAPGWNHVMVRGGGRGDQRDDAGAMVTGAAIHHASARHG